jgi:chromosome segregation ATPase
MQSFGTSKQEENLEGFDKLWDISSKEASQFVDERKKTPKTAKDEIKFLRKEIEEKNFDIEKLKWQLSEREKELKKLYDEINKTLQLNSKLNKQLDDYQLLEAKYRDIIVEFSKNDKSFAKIFK